MKRVTRAVSLFCNSCNETQQSNIESAHDICDGSDDAVDFDNNGFPDATIVRQFSVMIRYKIKMALVLGMPAIIVFCFPTKDRKTMMLIALAIYARAVPRLPTMIDLMSEMLYSCARTSQQPAA